MENHRTSGYREFSDCASSIARFSFCRQLILIWLSVLIVTGNLHSQGSDCSYSYYVALNLYNNGMVDSAYNVLNSCIGNQKALNKSSKNTKADIYRLSALSCIILERPAEARTHIEKLLANQPYYKDDFKQDDLLEFKEIVNGFSVQPRITLGVDYYSSIYSTELVKYFTGHFLPGAPSIERYSNANLGLSGEFAIRKNISVGAGINFLASGYLYKGGNIPFGYANDYEWYSPNYWYIETPVFIKYKLRTDKKLKPYIHAGVISRYFIYSKNFHIGYPRRAKSSEFGTYYFIRDYSSFVNNNGVLAMFFENNQSLDLIFGGGISYSFKKSGLCLDVGYIPSLINTEPLKNIDTLDDLPDNEYFSQADDVIVVSESRKLRIKFSYKYYLSFKAF